MSFLSNDISLVAADAATAAAESTDANIAATAGYAAAVAAAVPLQGLVLKAWALLFFSGNGGAFIIAQSNVSSIGYVSPGNYAVTFTSNMNDVYYVGVGYNTGPTGSLLNPDVKAVANTVGSANVITYLDGATTIYASNAYIAFYAPT